MIMGGGYREDKMRSRVAEHASFKVTYTIPYVSSGTLSRAVVVTFFTFPRALPMCNSMSTDGDAQGEESMHINPQRAEVLAENLGNVLTRVEKVAGGRKACPADLVHVGTYTDCPACSGPCHSSVETQTSK